ncbi:MAG: FkbM family methyltransferase [Deltaproteobacteria bacterium]|nr:FkbM family methyltransferase [Deltaproteobacteria bacterium]
MADTNTLNLSIPFKVSLPRRILKRIRDGGLFKFIVYTFLFRILGDSKIRNRMIRFFRMCATRLGISQWATRVNGVRIWVDPRDFWVMREYVLKPRYNHEEIDLVRRLIPRTFDMIDIGANYGVWSFSLESHFSKIFLIEPNPDCVRCIQKTIADHQWPHLRFVPGALSDKDGETLFFPSKDHAADGRIYDAKDTGRMGGLSVKTFSFETFIRECRLKNPRLFIKMDVQGAEPGIIKGIAPLLAISKDILLYSECQDDILRSAGSSADEYFDLLSRFNIKPVDALDSFKIKDWAFAKNLVAQKKANLWFRYQA